MTGNYSQHHEVTTPLLGLQLLNVLQIYVDIRTPISYKSSNCSATLLLSATEDMRHDAVNRRMIDGGCMSQAHIRPTSSLQPRDAPVALLTVHTCRVSVAAVMHRGTFKSRCWNKIEQRTYIPRVVYAHVRVQCTRTHYRVNHGLLCRHCVNQLLSKPARRCVHTLPVNPFFSNFKVRFKRF